MKATRFLVLAAVAALALPALAGDADCEFRCSNACPLAQQANTHRADGGEALATSAILRADLARHVARNLERV